jgi:glycosyltransferase involved in cell wall biosynthesis
LRCRRFAGANREEHRAGRSLRLMRVIFIAYYFPPVGGAGVQRAQKFVQYLPGEGFLPVLITGPASSEDRWTPYDRTLLKTIPADVPIHRTEGPLPTEAGRLLRRVENWCALPGSFSKWWIRSATDLGYRFASGEDLILATMSPFESGEVARRLSERLAIPWIADLRDPWALDEMQVYPTFLHRKLEMTRMERLLSTAAAIIMNTPEASTALKQAFPRLRNKEVVTITNGFDREEFAAPVTPRHDTKFRIVHSGYLHTNDGLRLRNRRFHHWLRGAAQGVDILTRSHAVLLEAVDRWCSERPEVGQDLEVLLAGKTSKEDRDLASGSRVSSLVRFTGYVSHQESVDLVRTADLLFLPMHNLPPGKRSRIVPGKTYEYMASGRPILAAVPEGDARDYLTRCGTGLICRPDDVSGMVGILDRVYTAWKQGEPVVSPDHSFIRQFERRNLTHALAQTLQRVVEKDSKSSRTLSIKSEPASVV